MADSPRLPGLPLVAGERFGRLTVVEQLPSIGRQPPVVRCRCDCGRFHETQLYSLLRGRTRSCGCLQRETVSARMRKHDMSRSPEHIIWTGMWDRTTNPNHQSFSNYGGRGIRVCEEWRDFAAFYRDLGPRPTPRHSLDRIDVNGHYKKGNVRWATSVEQAHNRRDTRYVTLQGKIARLDEWAAIIGISINGLRSRLNAGWPEERILEKSPTPNNRRWLEYAGRKQTVPQWAAEVGIPAAIIRNRLCIGWSVERALTTPVESRAHLIEYKGERKTVTEWARLYGLRFQTLNDRLLLGWSVERALTEPVNPRFGRRGKHSKLD